MDGSGNVSTAGTINSVGSTFILATPDPIGDWISVTQTSFVDVDVSDDGAPAGTTGVFVQFFGSACTTPREVRVRKNGDTNDTNANTCHTFPTSITNAATTCFIPVDASRIFEARLLGSAGACNVNVAAVVAYVK